MQEIKKIMNLPAQILFQKSKYQINYGPVDRKIIFKIYKIFEQ